MPALCTWLCTLVTLVESLGLGCRQTMRVCVSLKGHIFLNYTMDQNLYPALTPTVPRVSTK
eukprot:1233265-Amphidinium_carterae.1